MAAFKEPNCKSESVPCILLVDDEPRLLSSLYELLRDSDYILSAAASGTEALGHLVRAKFDVVLLDLGLPDITGHEIMDFINASAIDTSVIVTSGNVGIEAAIGALKRGACDYLRKPYTQKELHKTVDFALRRRKIRSANLHRVSELARSERLCRDLVDRSPDIIYMLDNEGRFTFINDRTDQLLGLPREALLGAHYSAFVHEDDLERARYAFHEHRGGERNSRNVELRLQCHNEPNAVRTFNNILKMTRFDSQGMPTLDPGVENSAFLGTLGVARDVTDLKRADEAISYQAYHDALTKLPNRMLFNDHLGLAINQAKRKHTELAVMFIDLDHFKRVNDTLGHAKGDELLRQATARLKDRLRGGDTLARRGGDEFTVLLPELRNRNDAKFVADKFLECLHQPFDLGGQEAHISASIGIAIYPDDGESIDELLRHADIAMYQIKAHGKDGHSFYNYSMLDSSYQKVVLEQSLRMALEQNELEMYYQPQMDVITGRVVGAEGLMRWNHPQRGLLTASEFLPVAQDNGLMLPISDWMIGALCRDLLQWNASGGEAIRLSLNLSPQYLDRGDFFEKMRGALLRHGISPVQIEVEITEEIFTNIPQPTIDQLTKLCQLGVSVAIEDFGTGHSSLACLQRFPFRTIKIDHSHVKEIYAEDGYFPAVLAIISIAHGLGIRLVAEGVETEIQARYLKSNGCLTMQGYLYHRPIMLSQFIRLLVEQDPDTSAVLRLHKRTDDRPK